MKRSYSGMVIAELWCSDFQKSLLFYTENLGFTIGQHKEGSTHAYLSLQGALIMISSFAQDGIWETGPFEKPLGRGINFSFGVDDVQRVYDKAKAQGLMPFVDMYTTWYWRPDRMVNYKEFAIQDPDGYLLRFSECIGSRPIKSGDESSVLE